MDLEDYLIKQGLIDQQMAVQARQEARIKNIRFEEALVSLGHLDEENTWRAIAKVAGLPFVKNPGKGRIPEEVQDLARPHVALLEENKALPVMVKEGKLILAVDDPTRTYVADNLGFILGREILCAIAPPTPIRESLDWLAGKQAPAATVPTARPRGGRGRSKGPLPGEDDDAPIIRLVETTFEDALRMRSSDIHIECYADRVRVRFRVDGMLRDIAQHPRHLHGPLISRLKIMAGLDIAEKRKPQDGRIQINALGKVIDVRTSVLPTNNGETVVMRLLDREESLISLEGLGFHGDDYAWFRRIIQRPHGIFLVTGPTGSGKTTTLYAALSELNRPDVKIITAEDPVEYHLGGINQCQVRHNIGLSFARVLRAMLRQAPNIILVGEIRDAETAEIAIQAALTGHLVFSTLHTNDSPSALTRLIDMGVKPFLVAASVQAIMAQRLIRTLCPDCKEAYQPTETDLRSVGLSEDEIGERPLYRPVGCNACEGAGYRGRKGIFEMLEMDGDLREMTFRKEPTNKLSQYARGSGNMTTLIQDGRRKILEGITSIAEVLRVTVQE